MKSRALRGIFLFVFNLKIILLLITKIVESMIFRIKINMPVGKVRNLDVENQRDLFWKIVEKHSSIEINPKYAENFLFFEFASAIKEKMLKDLIERKENVINELERLNYPSGRAFFFALFENLFNRTKNKEELRFQLNQLKNEEEKIKRLTIQIDNIRYGSLIFDLLIGPEKNLPDMMSDYSVYAETFLKGYIAEVFTEVFSLDDSLMIDDNVTVLNIISYHRPLNKIINHSDSNLQTEKHKSARFYWYLANGSLVLPVLIMCFFLYYIGERFTKSDNELTNKLQILFENQNKLIDHYQKELSKSPKWDDSLSKNFCSCKNGSILKKTIVKRQTPCAEIKAKLLELNRDCKCIDSVSTYWN